MRKELVAALCIYFSISSCLETSRSMCAVLVWGRKAIAIFKSNCCIFFKGWLMLMFVHSAHVSKTQTSIPRYDFMTVFFLLLKANDQRQGQLFVQGPLKSRGFLRKCLYWSLLWYTQLAGYIMLKKKISLKSAKATWPAAFITVGPSCLGQKEQKLSYWTTGFLVPVCVHVH